MALDKKTAVIKLFKEGYEQKEIAKLLRLSEVTVSRYVNEKGLKKKLLQFNLLKETSEENALSALNHQSRIIKLMGEKLAEEMPENPTIEQLKAALIPKGEIDALQKLFTTIKGKELEWSTVVRIIREFMEYLKEDVPDYAADIVDYAHNYIEDKRKMM